MNLSRCEGDIASVIPYFISLQCYRLWVVEYAFQISVESIHLKEDEGFFVFFLESKSLPTCSFSQQMKL